MAATTSGALDYAVVNVPEKGLNFVIMNAPTDKNINQYCKLLQEQNVETIVRVCKSTYNQDICRKYDISVESHAYADGSPPPQEVIRAWLNIVERDCKQNNKTVAVHCVAGLGRAPVLVVLALIEFGGMDYLTATKLVRKKRRGAINAKQLTYLTTYKAQNSGNCCTIL